MTEKINLQTAELKTADVGETPTDESKNEPEIQNTSEDIKESKPSKGGSKHLVSFVGNGVWTDAKGEMWHRTNEKFVNKKTFTEKEYNEREDIKFMVGYGAMKLDIV